MKKEEVFSILEQIYTGNFTRPGPKDLWSWVKLWRAAKKFEMQEIAEECWKHVPEYFIKKVVADHCQPTNKKMKQCAVCFVELKEPLHCLIPCGHTATCLNCIEEIQRGDDFQKMVQYADKPSHRPLKYTYKKKVEILILLKQELSMIFLHNKHLTICIACHEKVFSNRN